MNRVPRIGENAEFTGAKAITAAVDNVERSRSMLAAFSWSRENGTYIYVPPPHRYDSDGASEQAEMRECAMSRFESVKKKKTSSKVVEH